MESSFFFSTILPLTVIIAILVVVVIYLSRKTEETDYEREMKRLRLLLIKGELDRDAFLQIRDHMSAEDIFAEESQRIDDMLKNKQIDQETYIQTKQVLEHGFNERLERINQKYNYDIK
jgi:hypothetical protein